MFNIEDELFEIENYSDYELVDSFQSFLTTIATSGAYHSDEIYKFMRQKIVQNKNLQSLLPSWVKTNRDVSQFWNFIKHKFPSYAERRDFIKEEFDALLNFLEFSNISPMDKAIIFDESYIHAEWEKALKRQFEKDLDGAITISRTLIESVLKFILEQNKIYIGDKDLSELYKEVAKLLNLAPEQHQEQIFKQILGGMNGVVSGLGSMRNKLGDSHGKPKGMITLKERHSELAVNLSGAMAIFLFKTFKENQ